MSTAANTRNLPVLERRLRVARYARQGWAQRKMAEEEGVGVATINADMKANRAAVRLATVEEMMLAKAEQLAALRLIEDEAAAAWERSKGPRIKLHKLATKVGADGQPKTSRHETSEQGAGDYHFLAEWRGALADQRTTLGLNAATKTEVTGKDGAPIPLAAAVQPSKAILDAILNDPELTADARERFRRRLGGDLAG